MTVTQKQTHPNVEQPSKRRCEGDRPPTHCLTTEIWPLPTSHVSFHCRNERGHLSLSEQKIEFISLHGSLNLLMVTASLLWSPGWLKPVRCSQVWWPQNDTLSCMSWDCKSNEENRQFISYVCIRQNDAILPQSSSNNGSEADKSPVDDLRSTFPAFHSVEMLLSGFYPLYW